MPLSNVSPALAIMLIAFAYLEEDGALLCGALAIAFVIIAAVLLAAAGRMENYERRGLVPGLL